ncbi:aldo/keto reductase [Propionigenium maris DSM 9537]|uniref:Aldo/keto reductase n=1 Tax=Propionigenium maris DSM 9537 TaxID=1123000 RepID=A0A9W6LMA0_9FUSO|nr:aldo/keto reductase [Propionigenium maris]GLI54695.1 aldo/keto reductase [Propionigenium maris DSM 9537]
MEKIRNKKYRKTGRTGDLEISAMGIGTWAFDPKGWTGTTDDESVRVLREALDMGINLIDTAPVYGLGHSERIVGKAIGGYDREDIFIATKCGLIWDEEGRVENNLSRESLLKEIDEILGRLETEYVDLLQVHWPNPAYDIKETFETLAEIKASGKARYIGVSNYSLEDLKRAEELCEITSFQGLYNMLEPNASSYHNIGLGYRSEEEILPYTGERGMIFLLYSPLMQGILAGAGADNIDRLTEGDVRRTNPVLGEEKYYRAAEEIEKIAME